MKHTNYTHTTTEHATIIARTALRTCAAKAGRAEKIDIMRAALAGRDAAAMRMYGRAMDDTDAYDALRVQPLTDAADLVQVAALAIIETGAPCIAAAICGQQPMRPIFCPMPCAKPPIKLYTRPYMPPLFVRHCATHILKIWHIPMTVWKYPTPNISK